MVHCIVLFLQDWKTTKRWVALMRGCAPVELYVNTPVPHHMQLVPFSFFLPLPLRVRHWTWLPVLDHYLLLCPLSSLPAWLCLLLIKPALGSYFNWQPLHTGLPTKSLMFGMQLWPGSQAVLTSNWAGILGHDWLGAKTSLNPLGRKYWSLATLPAQEQGTQNFVLAYSKSINILWLSLWLFAVYF